MSTIPESIMSAAREAISPWTIDDGSTAQFEACALSVAHAILAERLRCASIAKRGFDVLLEKVARL